MKKLLLFLILLFGYADALQAQNESSFEELNAKMEALYMEGKYEAATEIAETCAALAQSNGQDSLYTTSLTNLSILYEILGKYEKASIYADKALHILTKKYGRKHPSVAITLNSLGGIYRNMGKYAAAQRVYEEAKNIQEQTIGIAKAEYAHTLNNLALLHSDIGNYDKAEPLLLKAIQIFDQLKAEVDPIYAIMLNNLAQVYRQTGNFADAELMYTKALELDKSILGENHPNLASSYNNLALLYYEMFKFRMAEKMYLSAIAIDELSFGKNHPQYANTLNNLAIVYQDMGEYDSAMAYQMEALAIKKELVGEKHPDYILSLSNLSSLYNDMGQHEKALPGYLKAAKMRKLTLGDEHPLYAASLNNLGFIYQSLSEYKKSETNYLRAIAIMQKVSPSSLGHVRYLKNLGRLYDLMKAYDKSQSMFLTALGQNLIEQDSISLYDIPNISKKIFKYNQLAVYTLISFSDMYWSKYSETGDKKDLLTAYDLIKEGIYLQNSIRNKFTTEEDKLRTLREMNNHVSRGIKIAIKSGDPQMIKETFLFAELNKSMLLSDATKAQNARTLGNIPDSLVNKENKLKEALSNYKKQELEVSSKEAIDEVNRKINNLNLEIKQFKAFLERDYPKYYKYNYSSITSTAQDVQQILDESTAMLEYFLSDDQLLLFYITKDTMELIPLNVDKKRLAIHVDLLRKSLSDYQYIRSNPDSSTILYLQEARILYQSLFQPVFSTLKQSKIDRIIIIPDGVLGHIPYETLLTQEVDNQSSFRDMPFLLKEFIVSYNYSATLWQENYKAASASSNGKMLALAATYQKNILDSLPIVIRSPYLTNLRRVLSPLPAAHKEVNGLAGKFEGTFIDGDEATESAFKKLAGEYNVIHLAMHGLLNKQHPILSGLAFTENGDSLEDNFLQAWEISHLDLKARLVVLSACETGYGKFQQGEGVMSLARSFMYAGVPSLVVSLWQVNDQSTSLIMQNFYANLARGMDKARALQQAKLSYLSSVEDDRAGHPAFWAPFIQLGDSRAIHLAKRGANSWLWWGIGAAGLFLIGFGYIWAKRRTAPNK